MCVLGSVRFTIRLHSQSLYRLAYLDSSAWPWAVNATGGLAEKRCDAMDNKTKRYATSGLFLYCSGLTEHYNGLNFVAQCLPGTVHHRAEIATRS